MGISEDYDVAEADIFSEFERWEGTGCTETETEELTEQLHLGLRSLLEIDAAALMDCRSYDDFFEKPIFCPPEASPRTRARFSAVKRHGNCRTRKSVIIRPQRFDEKCDLTPSEWEKLLRPLLYNSVLEEIYVVACTSIDSTAAKEQIYATVGELLGTSRSLKFLFLEMGGMSAANVAQLSRGLETNPQSALEALIIIGRPQLGTISWLGKTIHNAPKLRHLWLKRVGALDEAAVKEWSEALGRSSSLVKLTLEGLEVKGVSKLLTNAYSEGSSRSKEAVQELELIDMDDTPGGWKQFFNFLSPNSTITALGFIDCSFLNPDDVFRNLLDVMQMNFTLRKVENEDGFSQTKENEATLNGLLLRNAELVRQSATSTLRK